MTSCVAGLGAHLSACAWYIEQLETDALIEETHTVTRGPEILVVDDDPANHQAIEAMVEGMKLDLTFVFSGEEALACLLDHDFAAVLLDVKMQGMDGFETATYIRDRPRTRHLPIIFMTAYGPDDQQAQRGYEIGAADYLFKPIVPQVLRAKLNVFAELHQRTEEVRLQGERLRELEREGHQRELEKERQEWEARTLRQKMAQQKRVNDELEALDVRKDEFLAMLAHELRNPLAALVGNLAVWEAEGGVSPSLEPVHRSMRRQVRLLTRLVDDLLDVSRISRGKLELQKKRSELGEVVAEALETCQPAMNRADIQIERKGPGGPVYVDIDSARIIQVIGNLVSNSVRHTPQRGKITASWGIDNGQAFVRVSDTGQGIEPELLAKIFDRYVQGENEHGGLGLGLALVKRLSELHGGSVDVYSDGAGKGACFTIWLPYQPETTQGASDEQNAQDSTRPTSPQACLRVALVEDDEDIRELLIRLLRNWGHDAVAAGDGESGVELIARTKPDVALLDVGLPGIDGYEVAKQVRRSLGTATPFLVIMSGYGDANARALSKKAAVDLHLTKPVEPADLQNALTQPMRQRVQ